MNAYRFGAPDNIYDHNIQGGALVALLPGKVGWSEPRVKNSKKSDFSSDFLGKNSVINYKNGPSKDRGHGIIG